MYSPRWIALILCSILVQPLSATAQPVDSTELIAEAEGYALRGNFNEALPLYERAIAKLADRPGQQQQLRYRYGIVLNAFGGTRPDLYPLARSQFEAVLNYIENSTNDEQAPLRHSAARVRSALAHTYHQQAANPVQPAQKGPLLHKAYLLYVNASGALQRESDWHNLAITYFNLGQVCEWQGKLEEAIQWLEKAVALDHKHQFVDLEEDRQYLAALKRQRANLQNYGATSL